MSDGPISLTPPPEGYASWLADLKGRIHIAQIGLLLRKSKNKVVAEYALRNTAQPLGAAEYQYQLVESLPPELQSSLPSIEQIERELAGDGTPTDDGAP